MDIILDSVNPPAFTEGVISALGKVATRLVAEGKLFQWEGPEEETADGHRGGFGWGTALRKLNSKGLTDSSRQSWM